MEPFTIALFAPLIIIYLLIVIWLRYQKRDFKRALKQRDIIERRNETISRRMRDVIVFRDKIRHLYGNNALSSLPSYTTMVYDTKDLTFTNYLNENQILNLN